MLHLVALSAHSLQCSQKTISGFYPESGECNMISYLFKIHLNIIRTYPLSLLRLCVCSVLFNDVISCQDFVALVMDGWMSWYRHWNLTDREKSAYYEKILSHCHFALTTNPIRTSLGLNLFSPRWWEVGSWQSEPWGSPEVCCSVPIKRMNLIIYVCVVQQDTQCGLNE